MLFDNLAIHSTEHGFNQLARGRRPPLRVSQCVRQKQDVHAGTSSRRCALVHSREGTAQRPTEDMGRGVYTFGVSSSFYVYASMLVNLSRLKESEPLLHERCRQLVACINTRKDSRGLVDLKVCFRYWAYDLMVSMQSCASLRNPAQPPK